MNFYLLDAGGAGLVIGFLVIFMLLAIVLEGVTLILLKYNSAGRAFLNAFVVNIASLTAGYLITTFSTNGLDFTTNPYLDFFLIFLITVIIEFAVLYLLNSKKPVKKTLTAAIVINLVSYLLLILFRFFITGW
jgi:hypothetical protein